MMNNPSSALAPARPRRGIAIGALALALTAAAQATPEKAARFYEDALQRYEKNDLAGAVLQLKNSIQQDNKLLAAHLLLGRVLLKSGQYKAAEAAFSEALRQGVSRSEVSVPLAQIYLQLGDGRKLLETITPSGLPPALQAEVLTLRGTAHAMSGNLGGATQSFAEARALDPKSALPLIAEAPLLLRAGEGEGARASAMKATELAPDSAASWYALGTILQQLGEPQAALGAFDRALAINPKHVDARVSRATVLLTLERVPEAEKELAQLKAWGVVEPRASYLRAVLAERKGDVAGAKAAYSEAVGLIDAVPPALLLGNEPLLLAGALSHRALGNIEKARGYLEATLARNARHVAAQKLLASILIDAKEYGRATPMLENLQRARPDDPGVLYLLGSVALARKQYPQAVDYFERATARAPSAQAMRELGFSQLGLGQLSLGQENLEKAFAGNPADLRAGVQLATLYARQGQNARAVQTAEAMVRTDPANLAMVNFLGNVKGRLRDMRGAREAFQQVLAKDPAFRAAVINLSWLDIDERRFDDARKRLTQWLTQHADDPDVLYQLGALEQRTRHPAEAMAHWQRANDAQRQDPRAGLAMVDLLLVQRQTEPALAAAKALAAKFPDNVSVALALSRAYASVGDLVLARQTLQQATRVAGFDPDLQLLIARLQLAVGNIEGASYSVGKALQARPDALGALVMQVEIAARRGGGPGGVDAAMKTLVAKHPRAASTQLAVASVALARGQSAAAVAGLRAAMDKEPASGTALMLAHAHIAAGEAPKALAVLETWCRQQPEDRVALTALAEVQLYTDQRDAARQSYLRLLAADPDDPALLSSYATLLQRLQDPQAGAMAEKAVKLAPGNPEYADTLGWILVEQGSLEAGLRHLREARLRDPNNGKIRFHLASALFKAGRREEARTELQAALSGAAKVALSPEVARLRTELGL